MLHQTRSSVHVNFTAAFRAALQQSPSSRQCHPEPTTARLGCDAAHLTTVLPCNLTDEAETEAMPFSSLRLLASVS